VNIAEFYPDPNCNYDDLKSKEELKKDEKLEVMEYHKKMLADHAVVCPLYNSIDFGYCYKHLFQNHLEKLIQALSQQANETTRLARILESLGDDNQRDEIIQELKQVAKYAAEDNKKSPLSSKSKNKEYLKIFEQAQGSLLVKVLDATEQIESEYVSV
jgi:hypothetical protein